MQIYFVGDLHLGHPKIIQLCAGTRPGKTVKEHDEWIMHQLYSVKPTKRTLWYILGDVAFTIDGLNKLLDLPGRKILYRGNHDTFKVVDYLNVGFEDIRAGDKAYGMWVTHIPVHPKELRGYVNLHGHCHYNDIHDPRYLNAAIEFLPDQVPITLDEVRSEFELRKSAIVGLE